MQYTPEETMKGSIILVKLMTLELFLLDGSSVLAQFMTIKKKQYILFQLFFSP